MMNRVAERQREAEHVRIPVVGAQNAPALVEWLGQQAGVTIVAGPPDPEKAVRDRSEDVVVIIPKDFAKRFSASKPAQVRIVTDSSTSTGAARGAAGAPAVAAYSAQIGSLRLIARGVSPIIATPLQTRGHRGLECAAAGGADPQLHSDVR